MKKILFLSIIALLALTSCSNEENNGSTIETVDVAIGITTPTTSTNTKQIKRGDIYTWVSGITIKATSNVYSYNVTENYTFDEQNGSDAMTISGIAVGSNTFTASTTTNSTQFFQLTNYTTSASTSDLRFDAALDNIDNDDPYVLYTGESTSSITSSGVNVISIPMTTTNGRLLSSFQVTDQMIASGYQATITATVEGETSQTAIAKNNELVTFKWSNANAVDGKVVTYTIKIAKINDQNTILKTYTKTQTIVASTSIKCTYLIDDSGITYTNTATNTINTTFQEWNETECTTCK